MKINPLIDCIHDSQLSEIHGSFDIKQRCLSFRVDNIYNFDDSGKCNKNVGGYIVVNNILRFSFEIENFEFSSKIGIYEIISDSERNCLDIKLNPGGLISIFVTDIFLDVSVKIDSK